MLYDDGMIEHDEYTIYNMWFDHFIKNLNVSGIIYVKADPTICDTRVKKEIEKVNLFHWNIYQNVMIIMKIG